MENSPLDLMFHRVDLYGFAYGSSSGEKVKTPILKKAAIRCNVQEAMPDVVTWYSQRQEMVSQSVYLIDSPDFDQVAINDRIVFEGSNFRVKGRQALGGFRRVFRVDLASEIP